MWDPAVSWAPTAASETQYRAARRALQSYNERLADGDAIFEARADNLMATLDRIAADVGSSSATIDKHLAGPRPWFWDTKVDDIFYNTKGRLYAYYLLLKALETDYEKVIRDRELGEVWKTMLDEMREAESLSPWIVMNGDTDGIAFPNHLATQGFYLLRARTTLREIPASWRRKGDGQNAKDVSRRLSTSPPQVTSVQAGSGVAAPAPEAAAASSLVGRPHSTPHPP